jgi:serine/threonine protein kinase/tetratricopeptide (TPR) repeat protein
MASTDYSRQELTPGRTIAHYRIERLIGQGGMGTVFLAEDTRLHRKVALKVLPAEMAANADRLARFRREAQAVAALNHPHIVTIHSVEEAEGTHFLTMELVEGTNLEGALRAEGLSLTKVFDVAIALADALAAAHEKGIIHRDLKPANIMIAKDGRVKVLDFGIAKLAPAGTEGPVAGSTNLSTVTSLPYASPSLTDTGMVMGTTAYMSPEQVKGAALDARTDIFSLGIVLYEMATGRRPFGGKTRAETISSILCDDPRPLTQIRLDAPVHLGRIVEHCLQKDPEARFQTAKDVGNELRSLRQEIESDGGRIGEPRSHVPMGIGLATVVAISVAGLILFREFAPKTSRPLSTATEPAAASGTISAVTDPRSIAVLPFVNMSSDKEQEYFSDGISEELLNLLAKIPELKVAARTSSFSFKGRKVEIPEIARRLHVAHVLEGSVRKSGSQVRIKAELIHAADGFHIWSQTYDRKQDDIFKIQEEIAAEVMKELKVTLLGAPPRARTTDPRAYSLYLQALEISRQFTAEGFKKSAELYRKVLAIDPQYAPAWRALARNFLNENQIGVLSNEEGDARARAALTKALAIDPQNAPAYAELGLMETGGRSNLAGAAEQLERALSLDPRDPVVLTNTSILLGYLGRRDEAIAVEEELARRDPVNATALYVLGVDQRMSGRLDAAVASFRTALSLSPEREQAHFQIAAALLLKGDAAGALTEIEQENSEFWRMFGLPMAYHALGRKADSDAALAALIAKYEKDAPYNIASVYGFRGEADKTFKWLDKTVEYGDPGVSEIVSENLFAGIRSDPRWLPFLRKIGRAPEQLVRIEFKVTLPKDMAR